MTSQPGLMQEAADPSMNGAADRFVLAGVTLPSAFRPHGQRDRFEPSQAALQGSIVHDFRTPADISPDQPTVRMLVALLLRQRPQEPVETFLDALVTRGLSAEHIYLRLFQPAARRLGDMWLDDTCSFVEVTLAMAYLQAGMRHLDPQFQRDARPCGGTRTIVLTTLGDDQHTFGMTMTAAFFRRAGWAVVSPASSDSRALAGRLRHERNAVVGFSVSRAEQLPALAAAIRDIRRLGRACIAGVLAGGPVFATRPELAREAGADAVGFDGRSAVAEAEAMASAGECG